MTSVPAATRSVLVVDDEPTIADVVARYLERSGYRARVAGDGLEALRMAGEERPDLVVLDIMLPGLDGLEVMRRLREGPGVAVILLTAKGDQTDRIFGLRQGADDYVVKTTYSLFPWLLSASRRSTGRQRIASGSPKCSSAARITDSGTSSKTHSIASSRGTGQIT